MTAADLSPVRSIDVGPSQAPQGARPLDLLRGEIDRVFEAFQGDAWPSLFQRRRAFSPTVGVIEAADSVDITVELPGVDQADISIVVIDDALVLRGEKKPAEDRPQGVCRLAENSYGAFERSIALPRNVDAGKTTARLTNGVLRISAPRSVTTQAQTVTINTQ